MENNKSTSQQRNAPDFQRYSESMHIVNVGESLVTFAREVAAKEFRLEVGNPTCITVARQE